MSKAPEDDPQLKRKIQNRDAQRRFRNRKKTKTNVISLPLLPSPAVSANTIEPLIMESGPIPTALARGPSNVPEFRFEPTFATNATDDNMSQSWSASPAGQFIFDDELTALIDENSFDDLPIFNSVTAGMTSSTESNPPSVPGRTTGVQGIRARSEPALPHEPRPPASLATLSRQQETASSAAGTRGGQKVKHINVPAKCCVAHRAESMLAEVQELCRFGKRFGLLDIEGSAVQNSLSRLRKTLTNSSHCDADDLYDGSEKESLDGELPLRR